MAAQVQDSGFFTRRGIVAVAIIGFHVLVAWGLASGLANKVIQVLAPPIEADIVDEVKKDDQPPPPPPPRAAGTPAKMTRPANPDDYYPPGSIRREEQGSPVVQACVGPKGTLLR